jgi:hypothetical protein
MRAHPSGWVRHAPDAGAEPEMRLGSAKPFARSASTNRATAWRERAALGVS